MADRPLRVIHLGYADDRGGAAIGARRSHNAMKKQGVDSRLVVVNKHTDDPDVIQLPKRRLRQAVANRVNRLVKRFQVSGNPIIRTPNLVPMGTARFLNAIPGDVIQMHWIAADTISIGELAALNKPVFWKLPDMWGFSGAEHYLNPGDPERFQEGYIRENRPAHESGFDLDRRIWQYKRWRWRDARFNIIGPSRWVADCARRSLLFKDFAIRSIPNPLDLDLYRPTSKEAARASFGLPTDKRLIMFGAMHATKDRRKGFQHLKAALDHLGEHLDPQIYAFVILGSKGPDGEKIAGFDLHYLGIIRDEARIVDAYNTADLLVLPAEADNLPNVIKEATCCGVPCAGFEVGGMPDMVDHLETGYLAKPYDPVELAAGIGWVAKRSTPALRAEVRARAETKHAEPIAVGRYLDFYRDVLGLGRAAPEPMAKRPAPEPRAA